MAKLKVKGLFAATCAALLMAASFANAADKYKFRIELTCCDSEEIVVMESQDSMSKAECKRSLRLAIPVVREDGNKIISAKCVVVR